MSDTHNSYGQPVGFAVAGWHIRPRPPHTPLSGRYCLVEKLDLRHAAELYAAYAQAADDRDWTYMSVGPFRDPEAYRSFVAEAIRSEDPLHHAILDAGTGKAVGTAALLRIDPANGVMEVGHIAYAPCLKRSRAGTEAMYLLMRRAFDELGYRRYEWKCDSLNAPSRDAAARYGFRFEGIFRQAAIYKGRNRNTAWFAITDRDWQTLCAAFAQWLAPENFDASGRQLQSLAAIRRTLEAGEA
jgi:RimJ/RimL family protein N-acetyltransferase